METQQQDNRQFNWKSLFIAIIIGAWFIAMGIIIAGWLISKQIAKNEVGENPYSIASQKVDFKTTSDMPSLGNGDSKVSVVLFADFQCPYCKQFHDEVYSKLKTEFIDTNKIKFTFADFAFLGEESNKAAEAARCALPQNKFWEYFDYLYAKQQGENEESFSDSNLQLFAKDLQLNTVEFNKCFDSRINKPIVETITSESSKVGISSTPTVLVNGIKFEGILPYETLRQVILAELNK